MKRRIQAVLLCLLCFIAAGCAARAESRAGEIPAPETARFATVLGSAQEILIETRYPSAQVLRYESFADVLLALREGKADYALIPGHMLRTMGEAARGFVIVQRDIFTAQVGAALRKDEAELLAELNACLRAMKADGTLAGLYERWVVPEGQYRLAEVPVPEGKNGVLRVGMSANHPPMEFVMDGKYAGLDAELASRLALQLDRKLEIVNIPFASLITALSAGEIDVILSGLAITEERRQAVNFSEVYFEDKTVMLRYDPAAAAVLESLETSRFAVLTGSNSADLIRDSYPQAELSYYDTTPDCILAVSEGKADYAPVTYYNALPVLEAWPDLDTVDPGLQVKKVAMAVAKGNTELRDRVNELLARWQEDGTLADMKSRWFRRDRQYVRAQLPEAPAGAQTLRVGVVATQEPFCFLLEDAYAGFDVELTARIADALGMAVSYTDVPMASLFAGLETGSIDLVASAVGITPEREQLVDFTSCYVENPIVLVCRKEQAAVPVRTSFWTGLRDSFLRTFVTENRWKLILSGLGMTLLISVLFALFGTALGFGMCLLRRSRSPIPRLLVDGLCGLIRGIPMVVFLLVLNYVIFVRTGLSGAAVSVIGFSVVFACAVCGMLTVGLDGVSPGELEAGLALGYTPTQVFLKIGLPQAVRQVLPIYRGEFIGTMKLTSIVGYIAVQDLTKAGDLIRARTMEAFFPLLVTAAIYFLIAYLLSTVLRLAEKWVDPKSRKRTVKGVKL